MYAQVQEMGNQRKKDKELKRRYGKLADSMEAYYHHLDFRPLFDLEDEGFAFLMQKVKGVDMLDLNETKISNKSIELIAQLEYVKELRVKGCKNLDNDCISFIGKINNLEFLHVKGTGITIEGLLQLSGLPKLNTILFSSDDTATIQDEITQLKQNFPYCELVMNGITLN